MQSSTYKKGQGYWTRLMSTVGFGLLVLLGAVWLFQIFDRSDVAGDHHRYIAFGVALVVCLAGALGIWWYCGANPRSVDFFVATEQEMKKVNWSTRRELVGSTMVVIGTAVLIAAFCKACDLMFSAGLTQIGVLQAH